MNERIAQVASEQIDVSPPQQNFLLNNQDKLPAASDTSDFIGDTNRLNLVLNDELSTNPRFIRSMEDDTVPEARNFRAIKKLLADRNHAPGIRRYGNEFERAESLVNWDDVYDKAGLFGQVQSSWNFAMQGLLMGERQRDLMNARQSGDPQRIEEALAAVQRQESLLETYRPSPWALGRGLASLGASMADKPEVMIIGALVSVATAGLGAPVMGAAVAGKAGMVAGSLTSAGLTYSRVSDLYAGQAYQAIKEMYPDIDENRAFSLAQDVGMLAGTIEALPMLFSAGLAGRGMAKINKPLINAMMNKNISKATLNNPAFQAEVGYQLKKNVFGKWALDTLVDTNITMAQELLEQSFMEAAVRVAGGNQGTIVGGGLLDIADFIMNPAAEEHAQKRQTMLEIALASPFMSAGFSFAGRGMKTMGEAINRTDKNLRYADKRYQWHQESRAAKEAPADVQAHLAQMVADGTVPSTVFLDENMARQLMETRQDVAQKLNLVEAMQNRTENGGMIEISMLAYDPVVNSDGKLFQQIRNSISFDPEAMSKAVLMESFIATEKRGGELALARQDPNSAYRQAMDALSRVPEMTTDERQFNASIYHLAMQQMSEMSTDNPMVAELMKRFDIRVSRTNPQQAVAALTGDTSQQPATGEQVQAQIQEAQVQEARTAAQKKARDSRKSAQEEIIAQGEAANQAMARAQREYADVVMKNADLHPAISPQMMNAAVRDELNAMIGITEGATFPENSSVREVARELIHENPIASLDQLRSEWGELQRQMTIENSLILEPDSAYALTDGISDNIAGVFERQGENFVITLERKRNATTFAHELFHAFNNYMIEQYNNGTLTPYWKNQAEKLSREVGGQVVDGKMVFSDAAYEKAAGALTNYLLQGKMSNRELLPMMSVMQHYFAEAYAMNELQKVRLNKNITNVFDSIFMAQVEMEQMQRNLGLLAIEKPIGADNNLYNHYQSKVLTNRSEGAHRANKMAEQYKADLESPTFQKMIEARKNEILTDLMAQDPYKVKQQYNDMIADGVSADMAMDNLINEWGVQFSNEELTNFVQMPNAEKEATTQATKEAHETVRNKYDLLDETMAEKAGRRYDKAESLFAEYALLNNMTMEQYTEGFRQLVNDVDNVANSMTMNKLTDKEFWMNREAYSMERYAIFKQNGKIAEAARERNIQAQITLLRMRGDAEFNKFNRFNEQAKTFKGQQDKSLDKHIMDADSYDVLQSLLQNFGYPISSRRMSAEPLITKMENWTTRQEGILMTDIGRIRPLFPEMALGNKGAMGEMTLNQFNKLDLVFGVINDVASKEWFMIGEAKKTALNALYAETQTRIAEKGINTDSAMIGNMANPEPIFKAVLPQNVVDSVISPVFDGVARAENMYRKNLKRAEKAERLVNTSHKEGVFAGRKLKYRDVADLMLAAGTEHAFYNQIQKMKLQNVETANAVMSDALNQNPKYAQFMNEMWGTYADGVDVLNESYKKTFNKIFIKKEPRKFTLNGIEFEGGYVPENKNIESMVRDGDFMSKKMAEWANEKLITKEADGNMKSIVDNMRSHLFMQSRMAHLRPAFNNASNFMNKADFQVAVGEKVANFSKRWLSDLAVPPSSDSKLVGKLSGLTTVAVLGWSMLRAPTQLSSIFPAMAYVGKAAWGNAWGRTAASMAKMNVYQDAAALSPYMAARMGNRVEALFGLTQGELSGGKIGNAITSFGMIPVAYFDAITSMTTWNAQYDKSISQGRTAQQAQFDADSAVRITNSDFMQASRSRALQSQWARILTPFASYIMGLQSAVRGKLIAKQHFDAGMLALMYIVAAPIFEGIAIEALDSAMNEQEDDRKFLERAMYRSVSRMAGTLGTSVVPMLGVGGTVAQGLLAGAEKATGTEDRHFRSFAMSTPLLQYLDNLRLIAFNSPGLLNSEQRNDAFKRMLIGTAGFGGNQAKRQARNWLAED